MSKKKNDVPAVIENHFPELRENVAEFAEIMEENFGGEPLNPTDLPTVKMPSGGSTMWQVEDLEGIQGLGELEGIILYWHDHRAYWESSVEDGGSSTPDCASRNGRLGVKNAKSEAEDKGQGGDCANCPLSKFGSGPDGRQACKLMRRIFLLRPGAMLPTVINLPPTSIKGMRQFLILLSGASVKYHRALVGISLESAQSGNNVNYARAVFKTKEVLGGEDAEFIAKYREGVLPFLKEMDVSHDEAPAEGVDAG